MDLFEAEQAPESADRKRQPLAARMRPDQNILINLSGRGDKDVQTLAALEGLKL